MTRVHMCTYAGLPEAHHSAVQCCKLCIYAYKLLVINTKDFIFSEKYFQSLHEQPSRTVVLFCKAVYTDVWRASASLSRPPPARCSASCCPPYYPPPRTLSSLSRVSPLVSQSPPWYCPHQPRKENNFSSSLSSKSLTWAWHTGHGPLSCSIPRHFSTWQQKLGKGK